MQQVQGCLFLGEGNPVAFLLPSFTPPFRSCPRPTVYFVLHPHTEGFPVYFSSSVKLVMELGLLRPLTCFPQFKVSELWLLLTFLCEGFVYQSDLLPAWISRSDNFCCSSFWKVEASVSPHWIISSHPLVTMCLTWYHCALARTVS